MTLVFEKNHVFFRNIFPDPLFQEYIATKAKCIDEISWATLIIMCGTSVNEYLQNSLLLMI